MLFIEIFNWFKEKISKKSNYFNKKTFFVEINFSVFFSNLSKHIEKNLITPSGRG